MLVYAGLCNGCACSGRHGVWRGQAQQQSRGMALLDALLISACAWHVYVAPHNLVVLSIV